MWNDFVSIGNSVSMIFDRWIFIWNFVERTCILSWYMWIKHRYYDFKKGLWTWNRKMLCKYLQWNEIIFVQRLKCGLWSKTTLSLRTEYFFTFASFYPSFSVSIYFMISRAIWGEHLKYFNILTFKCVFGVFVKF